MKKFRFKFEALEKMRSIEERKALKVLGEAQRFKKEEEMKKQNIIQKIFNGLERREGLGQMATQPVHFKMEEDFIVGNKYRLFHADQAIFRAQKKVNKAMEKYLHAKKQLKMIEKLREREEKKYQDEVEKEEKMELDELMIMRSRFRKDVA